MDGKVLTLEEIINLDRRPTLQEVVDLSLDDYAKYLYHLGVIKYIPEDLYEYERDDDYVPDQDMVLSLNEDWFTSDLNENYIQNDGDDYDIDEDYIEDVKCEKESGILFVNDKQYKYDINVEGVASIYNIKNIIFY